MNAAVGGYLRDLAFAQPSPQKMFGYKRAAAAIFARHAPNRLLGTRRACRKSPDRPGSTRVIREILDTGVSPTVERAIDRAAAAADIERRRGLRRHFLSRAEVRRILLDPDLAATLTISRRPADALGMERRHPTVGEIADACLPAAITTPRSPIILRSEDRRRHVDGRGRGAAAGDRWRQRAPDAFRLLQGIEANIGADGQLDLTDAEAASFDLVLAAPHSRLRRNEDQTHRLLTAVRNPTVRILAHPRGRMSGSRAGVVADWDAVFAPRRGAVWPSNSTATRRARISITTLRRRALACGCIFALDSDAHTTAQLSYAETAWPTRDSRYSADRIVNCWPLDRLLAWLREPSPECRH